MQDNPPKDGWKYWNGWGSKKIQYIPDCVLIHIFIYLYIQVLCYQGSHIKNLFEKFESLAKKGHV